MVHCTSMLQNRNSIAIVIIIEDSLIKIEQMLQIIIKTESTIF